MENYYNNIIHGGNTIFCLENQNNYKINYFPPTVINEIKNYYSGQLIKRTHRVIAQGLSISSICEAYLLIIFKSYTRT